MSNANSFFALPSVEKARSHGEVVASKTGLDAQLLGDAAVALHYPNSLKSPEHRNILEHELRYKWSQTWTMYLLAITSAVSAAVQGMDESTVGGASLFYIKKFGIAKDSTYNANIQGIINSIPYLGAAVFGFLAIPSNKYFGRRVTVFWASILASASGLWQAFAPSWEMLMIGRLVMGVSIGVKSATVPVYTAECVPASIRGGVVMLWQTLTAFGVFLGFAMGAAFLDAGSNNWRFMLGSVFVLPLYVCATIFFYPESPRWYIEKERYSDAFRSFQKLRKQELIAARDFYQAFSLLAIERQQQQSKMGKHWYQQVAHFFRNRRNRTGALAAGILMFAQQLCGVNVLTFYISKVLTNAGFSVRSALGGSCGFGALAFAGDLTSIPLIDRFGRRALVLVTFPLMVLFLLWIGLSFLADGDTKLGLVLSGIYIYVFIYGLGAGPVPFTYSAEAFPLYLRTQGMAFSTGVTWLFCWVFGFTLPNMERSMGDTGVFSFYAGWCALLFVLIYLFVPETKNYTLEELDAVFGMGIRKHAKLKWHQLFDRKVRCQISTEYVSSLTDDESADSYPKRF
ncbi:Putative polyol transporter 1 [Wickerhamiella sorbophila]|uniref:Polyol transporter 1 n=1 Tax=Wickerhamiella sorbophila TaxID=45607 RepID=A0A2T0FLN2_9ASCO|nr:Putative polyol transporter 1 [Wickerhamiella sorbophila]PRT55901.1 Putative polyol transporter 1 [Wickerhamiella sorbophila]